MSDELDLPTLWSGPSTAENLLILAHGAGAPMDTDFMNFFAQKMAEENIRTLRFEFPYMALRREGYGRRPPNSQKILLTSWRQIIVQCRAQHPGRVFIGGKSMGGRMASMVADEQSVDGLICLGYPFYAPGKKDKPRTDHLGPLKTPTLMVQGDRDPMGDRETVEKYSLSDRISFFWLQDGNHDLKPRKVSGFDHQGHLEAAAGAISTFIEGTK